MSSAPLSDINTIRVSAWIKSSLLSIVILLAACSGGTVDVSETYEGSVLGKRPVTFRESREPVTGTVVAMSSQGQMLSETEYVDGFPNGLVREWYADGQPKLEREVMYVDRGENGGGVQVIGVNKAWCENGTLRHDMLYSSDGTPTGTHRQWSCEGNLLAESDMPDGNFKRWGELEDGGTVLIEEGKRTKTGFFDGQHKQYNANGDVILIETWQNEKQHGDYQRMHPDGSLAETGRFENGVRVGIWQESRAGGGAFTFWDYDPDSFTNQDYVSAFMQAAGIDESSIQHAILRQYKVDPEKMRYYVDQGQIDITKKINLDVRTRYNEFKSHIWTYPYIHASADALPVLLELGADPKAVDSNNRNRLHFCVSSLYTGTCNQAQFEELIVLGLDAGQADMAGNTPLHLLMNQHMVKDTTSRYGQQRKATIADHQAMIDMLVEAGADPDTRNNEGKTATMLALQNRMYDVAVALLEQSDDPNQTDRNGFNLVHYAFLDPGLNRFNLGLNDDIKVFVELAVSKGVDPGQPIGGNDSLIVIAEKNGAIELAQYLKNLQT